MKIKQKFLTVTMLAVLLFSTNNVWAAVCNTLVCPPAPAAPEIDAASGTAAIALLTGVVLYIRKRTKSKSSKSEE